MGIKAKPATRLRVAMRTIDHGLAYARHLVKGNYFPGEVSWNAQSSPPVVLAHGFLGTRGTMLPLTKRFQSDGRAVFSYHHGTFALASLRASAQQLVAQLAALEATLGVKQFDLVGFSMGGLVALHAVKFLAASRWVRRIALLGAPVDGTWAGLAGVVTVGALSPSVWQVLPGCRFLQDLRDAPLPEGVRLRQIHAAEDSLCPTARPLPGVNPERDYVVLPGGHSSLVVARSFYHQLETFFERGAANDDAAGPVASDAECAAE